MKPLNTRDKLTIAALVAVIVVVWGAIIYEVATW